MHPKHKARHTGRAVVCQIRMYSFEAILAVIIVGIDDHKRTVYQTLNCQHSLAGAPGLGAAFRQRAELNPA